MKQIFSFVVLAIFTICISSTVVNAESTADSLINDSKKYIGTPYMFGAKLPSTGFDCSGFSQYVFAKEGIELPRTTRQQFKTGTPINKSDLIKGDLVFFQTYRKGPSHLGIYIENNKFIHASTSKGISISSLDESYWKSRYIGARRVLTSDQTVDVEKVFNDVSSKYWAFDEIKDLKEEGVINGDGNAFNPDGPITYEQVKTMIARTIDAKELPSKLQFDHDKEPTDKLTREEVSVLINKAYEIDTEKESQTEFIDLDESNKYYDEIQQVVSSGYIGGYSDKTFRPHNLITRAEFAVILSRVNENYRKL